MIWCVEDDTNIREIEIYSLQASGLDAKGFVNADEFFAALENETPDLVILDIMLPGKDGVEILKRIRNTYQSKDLPVIMATAKGEEYEKIKSLDLGADDYLVKPFSMLEMVSRVRAVLRRTRGNDEIFTLDTLVLNATQHVITIDGERVDLTFKEFSMLKLFLSHPRQAFSRDQLFSLIWGQDYIGETRTVDVHIRTLRKKIGRYGACIETVRNVGYRLEESNLHE